MASAEVVRDLLLPAETTVHEKWLPAEIVRAILLPAETLGRKLNHMDSLCRKLFTKHNSLGRKQEIADSLGGSQIRRTVSAGSVKKRTHLYPVPTAILVRATEMLFEKAASAANSMAAWENGSEQQLELGKGSFSQLLALKCP